MLDEPELHLNPDLVRAWVTYLSNTVATGQVWLATHSLEAVEAAGVSSTVLLERNATTKLVDRVGSIAERPVLSVLSRAVGTPAFSITSLRFVLIEEEAIGERERYRRMTGLDADTRFIECGPCSEVVRRLASIHRIANEAGQPIRIIAIIDKDWRSTQEVAKLEKEPGLIVLPVHEIENFFLDEGTIVGVAKQLGQSSFDYKLSLRDACDTRAGGWIVQSALSDESASDISDLPSTARALAHSLTWQQIEADSSAAMKSIADQASFDQARTGKLITRLEAFAKMYGRKRDTGGLWKICEGKEVAKVIARNLGLADHHALERTILAYWKAKPKEMPTELTALRQKLMAG